MGLHLAKPKPFNMKQINALSPSWGQKTLSIFSTRKKRTIGKTISLRFKIMYKKISPAHWFDNIKDIHIELNEFCHKAKKNKR